jgi:hypothetical protein
MKYTIDGSPIPETAEELKEAFAQEPAGPLQPAPLAELFDDVREGSGGAEWKRRERRAACTVGRWP